VTRIIKEPDRLAVIWDQNALRAAAKNGPAGSVCLSGLCDGLLKRSPSWRASCGGAAEAGIRIRAFVDDSDQTHYNDFLGCTVGRGSRPIILLPGEADNGRAVF